MKSLDRDEETRVMSEFYLFWEENERPKAWFWYADKEMWKRGLERNQLQLDIVWSDLYQVFREEPFVVKGCKNFKLKSLVTALSNLGEIDVEFAPESCSNGLEAMMIAWEYYNMNVYEFNDSNVSNVYDKFEEMIKYNQLDCIYLEKLLDFARSL